MNHRRHLAIAIAALAVALSACTGGSDSEAAETSTSAAASATTTSEAPATTDPDAESTTTTTEAVESTTTTTAATTTTTEEVNEYALALAADGLLVVEPANGSTTNTLPFGSSQNVVINALTDLLGPPSELNPGFEECGNGQDFVAIWDSEIMVEFGEEELIGWSLRPGSTLTDPLGIGRGTSVAALRDRWSVTVEESTLGTEFSTGAAGSGFGGLLSNDTGDAVVDDLWAGSICVFR